MAYLYRLIWIGALAVAACLVMLTPLRAHAAGGTWTVVGGVISCTKPTLSAAGACWVQQANELAGDVLPYWRYTLASVNESTGDVVLSRQHCNVVSGCVAQPQATIHGTFTPDPVDPAEEHCASIAGSPVKTSWTTRVPSLSSQTICMSNAGFSCSATIEGDICGAGRDSDGVYLCHGSGVSGGGPCTPSETPEVPPSDPATPPTDYPDAPPPGTCPGTFNGVAVNVPCSNTTTKDTTTSESNDGEGNTTAKTENKTTTCNAAGRCTTTVTTTTTVNGGTPKTTTSSTTQGKGEFCATNKGSKECGDGDGSSFGGNCEASFVCTGDAVQCALTKEVHAQHCKLNKPTDEGALYGAEKGRLGDQTGDLPGNETIPFGPGSFNSTDAIGGAACIGDLTISHEWLSATLPLSMICGPLLWFRGALLFIGGIAWLLIVFRRRG